MESLWIGQGSLKQLPYQILVDILIFFLPVETDCFGSLFIGDGQSDLHYCNVLFFYRQMYFIVAGQDFAIVSKDRSLIAQFELIDMQEFINFLLQGGVNTVFKKRPASPVLRR